MIQENYTKILIVVLTVQAIFGFAGIRRAHTLAIRVLILLGLQIGIAVVLVILVFLCPPPSNGDALEMGVALVLLIGYSGFVWLLIIPNLVFCIMIVLRLIKPKQIEEGSTSEKKGKT